MSDMKYDAIVGSGIPILKRYDIPAYLIPPDSQVESEFTLPFPLKAIHPLSLSSLEAPKKLTPSQSSSRLFSRRQNRRRILLGRKAGQDRGSASYRWKGLGGSGSLVSSFLLFFPFFLFSLLFVTSRCSSSGFGCISSFSLLLYCLLDSPTFHLRPFFEAERITFDGRDGSSCSWWRGEDYLELRKSEGSVVVPVF